MRIAWVRLGVLIACASWLAGGCTPAPARPSGPSGPLASAKRPDTRAPAIAPSSGSGAADLAAAAGPFVEVEKSHRGGCLRKQDGSVWCWSSAKPALERVAGIEGAVELMASREYYCARIDDGTVRCWERSPDLQHPEVGQLPKFEGLRGAKYLVRIGVVDLCVGTARGLDCPIRPHARPAGAPRDGDIWSVAVETKGRVHSYSDHTKEPVFCHVTPTGVAACPTMGASKHRFTAIAFSRGEACGITTQGRVACTYRGGWSRVVDATYVDRVLKGPEHVVQIEADDGYFCARAKAGAVWCWGQYPAYQRDLPDGVTPQRVVGLAARDISVLAGEACAVTTRGGAVCWGNEMITRPSPVVGLAKVTEIATARGATCARNGDDDVMCWGRMSLDDRSLLYTPTSVPEARGLQNIALVDYAPTDWVLCGTNPQQELVCVVRSEGRTTTKKHRLRLARIERGFVGQDTTGGFWHWPPLDAPRAFALDGIGPGAIVDWAAASADLRVLKGNGEVWNIGEDGNAKLMASGAAGMKFVPGADPALMDAEGRLFSADGGQLNKLEGIPRGSSAAFTFSAAIRSSTPPFTDFGCVLRGDGTVACNDALRLAILDDPGPSWVDIPSLDDAIEIHAGAEHMCILHESRTVSCVGNRAKGRLGDGFFHERK